MGNEKNCQNIKKIFHFNKIINEYLNYFLWLMTYQFIRPKYKLVLPIKTVANNSKASSMKDT